MKPINSSKPILVTGAHRSGTTWVGKMLSTSSDVVYVSEPLNVHHRPGVLSAPIDNWYSYICAENQSSYLSAFHDMLRFRYHPLLEIKSVRSAKDIGRMFRDASWFVSGRVQHGRPLLKDPFAVFSAPWFANVLDCQIVILVRHPLAFVSSLVRLGWDFDFRDLLNQPLLMRDHLEPFREEMENAIISSKDILAQGSLLWRMVYTTVDGFRNSYQDFMIVRHEDLSSQPENAFGPLFASLGIAFTPKVQLNLSNSSQNSNPTELPANKIHTISLDSQANLSNWKKRLTEAEIMRIRELTNDVAVRFYPEDPWK